MYQSNYISNQLKHKKADITIVKQSCSNNFPFYNVEKEIKYIEKFVENISALANTDGGYICIRKKIRQKKEDVFVGFEYSEIVEYKEILDSFLKWSLSSYLSLVPDEIETEILETKESENKFFLYVYVPDYKKSLIRVLKKNLIYIRQNDRNIAYTLDKVKNIRSIKSIKYQLLSDAQIDSNSVIPYKLT